MDTIEPLTPSELEAYAHQRYGKWRTDHPTLDYAYLERRCPLDNGRHLMPPHESLGQLDVLPLELLTYIFLALDIPSLTTLRRVNRRAMSLLDSLHQYQMVLKHCPNVLRAIISIDARYFDCETLYKTLSTSKCATCYRFGSFLYLLTCKRVCHYCFKVHVDYLPVPPAYVARFLGLPKKKIKHLPHILSLPGRYTISRKGLSRKRITLFDWRTVVTSASMDPALDGRSRQDPRRYMAVISAPCLGPSGLSADWGFYCPGCRDEGGKSRDTKYTANDIVDHIRRDGPVVVVDRLARHI
ncbi:hypothetical protein F5Y08DRAFT_200204 [Xylaria arbuscula]|nr:hypothetical protein F5Y08DRAFT_200204 [Xylaria arbuscula]